MIWWLSLRPLGARLGLINCTRTPVVAGFQCCFVLCFFCVRKPKTPGGWLVICWLFLRPLSARLGLIDCTGSILYWCPSFQIPRPRPEFPKLAAQGLDPGICSRTISLNGHLSRASSCPKTWENVYPDEWRLLEKHDADVCAMRFDYRMA